MRTRKGGCGVAGIVADAGAFRAEAARGVGNGPGCAMLGRETGWAHGVCADGRGGKRQGARRGAGQCGMARARGAGKCGMGRAGSSGGGHQKGRAPRAGKSPRRAAPVRQNAAVRRPYGAGVPAVPAGVDAALRRRNRARRGGRARCGRLRRRGWRRPGSRCRYRPASWSPRPRCRRFAGRWPSGTRARPQWSCRRSGPVTSPVK